MLINTRLVLSWNCEEKETRNQEKNSPEKAQTADIKINAILSKDARWNLFGRGRVLAVEPGSGRIRCLRFLHLPSAGCITVEFYSLYYWVVTEKRTDQRPFFFFCFLFIADIW